MGLYKAASHDDFYYMLGNQEIMLNEYVVKTLTKESSKTKRLLLKLIGMGEKEKPAPPAGAGADARPKINTKETYTLRYDDDGTTNFRFAGCCCPIPGDDVLGFIADDGSVEVHTLDCPRASMLKASYGPRLLSCRWEVTDARFPAHIRIEGIDRHGILHQLISLISTHLSLDIRALDIRAEKEVFHADLQLMVTTADSVEDLCSKIRRIPGIEKAARI